MILNILVCSFCFIIYSYQLVILCGSENVQRYNVMIITNIFTSTITLIFTIIFCFAENTEKLEAIKENCKLTNSND